MPLPHCLTKLILDDAQREKLTAWVAKLPRRALEDIEECCTVDGRDYRIVLCDTGISTEFVVTTQGRDKQYRCDLTYDDDGALAPWDV